MEKVDKRRHEKSRKAARGGLGKHTPGQEKKHGASDSNPLGHTPLLPLLIIAFRGAKIDNIEGSSGIVPEKILTTLLGGVEVTND